eukprot:TRINITY_DN8450_c0_g1_i1.p1 TRINITY_DN8450_c0_g1~~TRINITY_DN8450_c0_g1_i1.p1  ORF type:complete len:525 (+),score=94.08 TRINITY_DN8450_c0_g1_i1:156-1730(+)
MDVIHIASNKLLGEGVFGKVYMGMLNNGNFVAVKCIENCTEKSLSDASKEYMVLKQLSHPNIVRVLDFTFDKDHDTACIVMDYIPGGSLTHVIKTLKKLPELAVKNFTKEIVAGLQYLHSKKIIHRDIKPANILLQTEADKDGARVKLADFGLCKILPEKSEGVEGRAVGTLIYMSPKAIEAKSTPMPQSDIWSLGCTVLEMAVGHHPWNEMENLAAVVYKVAVEKTRPSTEGTSEELRQFLMRCFNSEDTGETCDDIASDPFLQNTTAADPETTTKVTTVLRESDRTPSGTLQGLGWVVSTSSAGLSGQRLSGPTYLRGSIFRDDHRLKWELFWLRLASLDQFSGMPFNTKYDHVIRLVRYLMCREGLSDDPHVEVSYDDDFLPFMSYFMSPGGMITDLDYLNKKAMFKLGASTQTAGDLMKKSNRGAVLIRPSKREPGKLVITAKVLNVGSGVLDTKHFLVVRSGGDLSLYGGQGALEGKKAPTLRVLMDLLFSSAPEDFSRGVGTPEELVNNGNYHGVSYT